MPAFTPRALSLSLALILLSACARDPFAAAERTVRTGAALKAVQAGLGAGRQCAPLLDSFLPTSAANAQTAQPVDPTTPQVRALAAAGLVEPDPAVPTRQGEAVFRPTAAARTLIVDSDIGNGTALRRLCYARRQVTRAWVAPHGRTGAPFLKYSFRLVDAPAWASRPDMRAAFPWLADAYGLEHEAHDVIAFDEAAGGWKTTFRPDELLDPRIPHEAFGARAPGA